MSEHWQTAQRYLSAYAERKLAAVEPLFADEITLRDWKLRVVGKTAALAETQKNFDAVQRLAIDILAMHERHAGIAAELKIHVEPVSGDSVSIHVVDVFDFDADGRICAIRAYLGRGDEG